MRSFLHKARVVWFIEIVSDIWSGGREGEGGERGEGVNMRGVLHKARVVWFTEIISDIWGGVGVVVGGGEGWGRGLI